MLKHMLWAACLGLLALFALAFAPAPARAQAPGINPDSLSFLEEPLAFRIFGLTVNYNQLADMAAVYEFERDKAHFDPRTNFQVTAERQLPNSVTVGATYFGSYDNRDQPDRDEYEDRWALYAQSVWGRVSGGEVNDSVREATRRWRGTGNADLEFDNVVGTLVEDGLGGAYHLRLSAWTVNVGVDEDGNSDWGVTYERPNKYVDVRFTGRLTSSQVWSSDNSTVFDTFATGFVGQVEYGSLAVDLGLGYENFDARMAGGDRYWVSAGVHYKVRRLTLSAEGHWGELDGDSEKSAALGLRYDLARGFSFNLGYNYADADQAVDGIPIRSFDENEVIGSIRYQF